MPPLGRGAHLNRPPWLGGRGRHGKDLAGDASDVEEGCDENTKLLAHAGNSAVVYGEALSRGGSAESWRTSSCEGRLETAVELRCISVKSS